MNNTEKQMAFLDENEFIKIYDECLDNQPMATKDVTDNYNSMIRFFEEYIGVIQADMFRYAYQCGYEAGIERGAKA